MNILNKFKRGLAGLLSLSVAVSAVFVFHFPLIKAHAEETVADDHPNHCFCGESDCDHFFGGWEPLSIPTGSTEEPDDSEEPDDTTNISLPTEGCFYLTSDIPLNGAWSVSGDLTLCLNGNSIIMDGNGAVISVNSGTFTLCDCKGSGVITHGEGKGCGVDVGSDCTFKMYGGTISGNTVGVYNDGAMTVGGTAKIVDNTDGNVFLPSGFKIISIDSKSPLTSDESIGITTENFLPKEGDGADDTVEASDDEENKPDYIVIAQFVDDGNNHDYKDYYKSFFSDVEGIKVSYNEDSEDTEGGIVLTYDEAEETNPSNPGENGEHTHGDITFTEWTSIDELPTKGKHYYYLPLGGDEISTEWEIPAGVDITLCLNGQTLTTGTTISVKGNLTVCDYHGEGTGEITNQNGNTIIIDGGTLAVYDSKIYSGVGFGVSFSDTDSGMLTVGGTANISVELPNGKRITVDNLEEGANIRVKMKTPLGDNEPVNITGEIDEELMDCFVSDDGYSKEYDSENKTVVFVNKSQEIPSDKHEQHGNDGTTEWEPVTDTLPTTAGHYYLTKDLTDYGVWTPDVDGIYLCLNGHKFNKTISVVHPHISLCDCSEENDSVVNVTVTSTKLNVAGTLKAKIKLYEGALITVERGYKLRGDAFINVTTVVEPEKGKPVAITDEIDEEFKRFFESEKYDIMSEESENDADKVILKLEYKENEKPPVEPGSHPDHAICGVIDCKDHNPADWTAWTLTNKLPTDAGSYYLTDDVTLFTTWTPTSDINLCLNGYTITMCENGTAVYITEDLSVCDCSYRNSKGVITHADGTTGRGVYIKSGAAFAMYGGIIRGNNSAADNGAGVYNDGTFNMRGGFITENKTTGYGGGLYNSGFAVVEGTINKNSAAKKGGGVYQSGFLTVDEDAYIMNNTAGSSKSNVYLTDGSWINIGSQFDGEVGVSLQTSPKTGSPVTFAKGTISSSTVNKIKSDNSSFKIAKSSDKLTLSRKSTTIDDDDDDSDLELDISDPLASNEIPSADRTAIIKLLRDMPNWVVGAYYDVTLWEGYDEISDAGESLTVKLPIPASIRSANRDYKVIRVHDGVARVLDGTVDSNKTAITVKSRYFSTYAIIYSVSQSNSGVGTNGSNGSIGSIGSNGGYGNPAMGVQNDIPLAGLACGFTVLALAAPGKKIEQ